MPDGQRNCGECAAWSLLVNETGKGCATEWDIILGGCPRSVISVAAVADQQAGYYAYRRTTEDCADFRPRAFHAK